MLLFGCLILESKNPKLSKPLELSRLKGATGTQNYLWKKYVVSLTTKLRVGDSLQILQLLHPYQNITNIIFSIYKRGRGGGKPWPLLGDLRMQDYAVKPARNS